MLNCSACHELISVRENGALTAAQAAALAEHVAGCPACAADLQRSSAIAATLHELPSSAAPASLRAAVRQSLAAPASTKASISLWQRLSIWPQTWTKPRPALAWGSSLVAAACLLLLLARPQEFTVRPLSNQATQEERAPASPGFLADKKAPAPSAAAKSTAPAPTRNNSKAVAPVPAPDLAKTGVSAVASGATAPSKPASPTGSVLGDVSKKEGRSALRFVPPPALSVAPSSDSRAVSNGKAAMAPLVSNQPAHAAAPPPQERQFGFAPAGPRPLSAPGVPIPRSELTPLEASRPAPLLSPPPQLPFLDRAGGAAAERADAERANAAHPRDENNLKKRDLPGEDKSAQDNLANHMAGQAFGVIPASPSAGGARAANNEPGAAGFNAPMAKPRSSQLFGSPAPPAMGRDGSLAATNGLAGASPEGAMSNLGSGEGNGGSYRNGRVAATEDTKSAKSPRAMRGFAPAPATAAPVGALDQGADSSTVPGTEAPAFSFQVRVIAMGRAPHGEASAQPEESGEDYRFRLVVVGQDTGGSSIIRIGGLGGGTLRLEGGAAPEKDGALGGQDIAWRGQARSGQKIFLNVRQKSGGPKFLTVIWEQIAGPNQSKLVVVRTVPLPTSRNTAPTHAAP